MRTTMSEKNEFGDDILQVDTMKPDAKPVSESAEEKEERLKRTTAGQQDRESTPPGEPPADPSQPRQNTPQGAQFKAAE
jgi:hypothetical protein